MDDGTTVPLEIQSRPVGSLLFRLGRSGGWMVERPFHCFTFIIKIQSRPVGSSLFGLGRSGGRMVERPFHWITNQLLTLSELKQLRS